MERVLPFDAWYNSEAEKLTEKYVKEVSTQVDAIELMNWARGQYMVRKSSLGEQEPTLTIGNPSVKPAITIEAVDVTQDEVIKKRRIIKCDDKYFIETDLKDIDKNTLLDMVKNPPQEVTTVGG